MAKHLLDHTREELQAQLDEHLPLRPDAGRPISELSRAEYRDHIKALEIWNDRKNLLEMGLLLKREKSSPVSFQAPAVVLQPAQPPPKQVPQVQTRPPIPPEPIKETKMPKSVDMGEYLKRYNHTLATMPGLEGDEEAWEQAKRRAYDLRWRIRKIAEEQGVKPPALADLPPSPFSTQGVHKRAAERSMLPVHVDDAPKKDKLAVKVTVASPESEEEAEEVTLVDLIDRLQASRQELASILSDAQMLERSERCELHLHMAELVIVANGCDAALAPMG